MLWLRRFLIILIELVGAALAGFAVLAGLLAWRLADGPMRLEALEPYLLQSLTQLAEPYKVTISETSLIWGENRTSIGLSAKQIRILTPNGQPVANIPEIEVGVSVAGLMMGRIAPAFIRLIGPQLHAYRLGDGNVRFSLVDTGMGAPPSSSPEEGDFLNRWMEALTNPPDASSQLGALRRIQIKAARLAVDDYQFGVHWRVPRADLSFSRDRDGMRGKLLLEVALGEKRSTVEGNLLYTARSGEMKFLLNLDSFNPADLVSQSPAFAELAQVNLPFVGRLQGRWVRDFGIADIAFDLSAGEGQFQLAPDSPALKVSTAQLTGQFDRQLHTAEISNFYIDFDGPRLSGNLGAVRQNNDVRVNAEVKVEQMPAARLSEYWPALVARNARHWVTTNVSAGLVPEANARIDLSVPLANPEQVNVHSVNGSMQIENASVRYFRALPEATEANGTATFTLEEFIVNVTSGRVGDIRIPTARVALLGLHDHNERADITLTVNGQLRDQLLLLDHNPLNYMKRLNLAADKATGRATTRAHFMFPLFGDLPIEMVAISAASRMENVSLPHIVAGQDLTNGQLDLQLDGGGMNITGTGKLGPAAANFNWKESFVSDVSPSSEISFNGSMNEEGRAAFKVSWPEVVGGDVGVNGHYTKDRGQPAKLEAQLDFKQARLSLPWFAWAKPEGTAGEGKVTVIIDKDVKSVPAFELSTAGAKVGGSVAFAAASQWNKVTLSRLSVPGTSLKGIVSREPGVAGLTFNFTGSAADIRGIYGEESGGEAPAVPAAAANTDQDLLPIDVTFDIAHVVTGEGRELNQAKGRIARNTRGWSQLQITGTLADKSPVLIRLTPPGVGREMDISTENAGMMLSTLRLMDNISGGKLTVTGRSKGDEPLEAVADLRDFRYLNAKTLQRIAAAADPEGAAQLVKEDGLEFERFKSRFIYREDSILVKEARMAGDLLGLTLQGEVNLRAGQLNLKGTLVPLYGINSMVSGIPVLGWLLTGGEGGGVFAATYTLTGPLKNPETSVNPLAMLAPGFLRNILFMGGD